MKPYCLIVDDHDRLRQILHDWLQSVFPDIEFTTAITGEEAIEIAQRLLPSVVLLDVGLPGMGGIETTRQIKSLFPQTFVIIHTIHDDQAYREDATAAGADLYITKNNTQTDLIPVLEKIFSVLNASKGAMT
jgi:DNA-binding NarL/FixJ family response regulator